MKTLARFLIAACALCVASLAQAQFQNGGFEQGDLSGWTIGGGSNPGLAGTPPFTAASIQISGSAPGPATVVGEITDANAPEIVLARIGQHTAKINDENTGALVTTLKQTVQVTAADIDPADGLPHIRFAYAPVMDDPGHSPEQQPYFYVAIRRVSDNSVLFEKIAYSGQPDANFLNGTGNWKYLPFQDVDAVLPANAVGESIELTVIAADCSLGGHAGYVYVDGFGSAPLPPAAGTAGPKVPVPMLPRQGLILLASALLFAGLLAMRRGS
ncbi:MAG TPA: hypothetical protein PLB00_11790 [Pseudomonadota bacterium]|jgi:hypothetical protein|nr:hypothetical protein [Pseudomonadota bacterium]